MIDIGAGPGTMAMLAVCMGASHVYALDPNPSVRLARLAVERNGMADKITVIEGVSTEFEPPQPVDIIVSDLRDRLPTNGLHIPSVVDARDRLLKRGGVQIPHRDMLYGAPVDHRRAYDKLVAAWQTTVYDLDMSVVIDRIVNSHEMYRASPPRAPHRRSAIVGDYRLSHRRRSDSPGRGLLDDGARRCCSRP